jgi:hypothetical protein
MPVGKRPAIKRKKKKVSPGGAKLSDRLGVLWDNWGDDLIERLVEDGINEADLLVLIGAKSNPTGDNIGKLFLSAYETAGALKGQLRALIATSQMKPAAQKVFVKKIEEFGKATELFGHLGAQFEMLAADRLHNSKRADDIAKKKAENSQRSNRDEAIKSFIVRQGLENKKAPQFQPSLKKALEKQGLTVSEEYLLKESRRVLKELKKSDSSNEMSDNSIE